MRKIITISLIIFVTCPVFGRGSSNWWRWKYGNDMECMKNDTGNDEYWWCGSMGERCAGDKMNKNDRRFVAPHGYMFQPTDKDGTKNFVCCNGAFKNLDMSYTWKNMGDNTQAYRTETITIDLDGGGKCTYQAKYNACGEEITTPCTSPTDCTDGLIKRNNVCIEPCAEGFAFESAKSNKCIECPTTPHSGPTTVKDESGKITDTYCLKCDADTEFFDKETDTCIKKSEMIVISPEIMAKCGLCDNNETVKKCIKCFASIGEYKDQTEATCKTHTDFKDNCFFPD